MTEHTAEELMAIQLDAEVAEAKIAVGTGADLIEELILKVVARWWFHRAMNAATQQVSAQQMEERRQLRIQALLHCVNTITAKSGPIDATSSQMSVLAMQSECAAIWSALIQAGIVSNDIKQDLLDGGIADLMARVHSYSQKILIATPNANGQAKAS